MKFTLLAKSTSFYMYGVVQNIFHTDSTVDGYMIAHAEIIFIYL